MVILLNIAKLQKTLIKGIDMQTEGVLVPIITPFDAQGKVNVSALAALVNHFIDAGVNGIVACGTTGEYYALTEDERQLVLSTVVKAVDSRVTTMAGINALSTDLSIHYAQQAKDLGYDGLMLAAPPYSLPEQDGIVAHFKAVAKTTDLPIIMYDFPARVGVQIAIETVQELAKVPNIVGIKESSGNFDRALALLQLNIPDFEIISGSDDMAADFLFWGAKGWISGGANIFPKEQADLAKAAKAGQWQQVRALMAAMYPVIQSMEAADYNQKAKFGCYRYGIDAGEVRLPLVPMATAAKDEFKQLLDAFKV